MLSKPKVEENFYEEPELPKTIEEVRRQVVYEPKVEYVVVEKKSDNDMFTLEEYRQMRAILEVIKEYEKQEYFKKGLISFLLLVLHELQVFYHFH